MAVNKIDPKKIFASQAPSQDVPAEFNNYERGWDESRKNNGKPTIKQFNKLQQLTDEKILWMHQNGAALPFDETMEYVEGAVVVKDGELQQWKGEEWKSVIAEGLSDTVQTFNTPEAGVDPVTGVADGAYFNVRSSSDESYVDEYQNVGGIAVATGKRYLSALGVQQQEKPASTVKDASGKTQQQLTSFKPNLLNDTTALPNTDVTAILNAWTKNADDNQVPSLEIPMNGLNYTLTDTVVIQEPLAIVGDKGATYDRGLGKKGWFLLGNNVGTAFDLGNNRTYSTVYNRVEKTSPNPADFWTIKNIGIKTDVGVPRRTQNGISFTNQHNGAERGVYISEVSMKDLDKCIHIAEQDNPSYWVTVATLNINNSVLTESNYGVYAEGRSYQTAIEGNQIEQNYEASIYGNFDGPFRAVNNIIEGFGQKAGIVFKAVQKAGNNPSTQAIIESQYFEGLQDSCIDISGNRDCAYWLRGNKNFGSSTKDYCIVRKGSVTRVYNEEQTYITLEDGAYLLPNSILTRNNTYGFYSRPTSSVYENSSVAHKLDSLLPPIPSQVTVNAGFTKTIAKIRDQLCYVMTAQETFPAAAISFSVGDLLEISVLTYCDSTGNGLSINGVTGGSLVASVQVQLVPNEWVTTTMVTRCVNSGSNITFIPQIDATTGTGFKIAGITVRNLGQYVAGTKYLVRPTQPTLHTIAGKHAQKYAYAGATITANGGVRKLDFVLSNYGEVGDLVQAALSVYVADLEISSIVRAGGVVQVTLKNPTTMDIIVPACQVRVIVL